MKLLDTVEEIHTRQIDYANIIFDHERRDALELILDWLKEFGQSVANGPATVD
jgi:hypothetical protein